MNYKEEAKQFIEELPYKKSPFNGRNWGNTAHSLCSYRGKLKPAIAHHLIKRFTNEGDTILDPMCGVGTIPLEACLQNRIGIGNDLSEMAYIVTKAKINPPKIEECISRLKKYDSHIIKNKNSKTNINLYYLYKDFGFNKTLDKYFHEETLKEIICLRELLSKKINILDNVDSMIYSCFLHVLHGNRPYALSRTSHPLTPYAPKGEYIYKNVCEHIYNKILLHYKKTTSNVNIQTGVAVLGDYKKIDKEIQNIDAIICSPPFADSIRFYMQNWMRLWLCGWNKDNFRIADDIFIDKKQTNDFSIYEDFFHVCSRTLKNNGKLILHLGKTEKYDMAKELSLRSKNYFTEIWRGTENVTQQEKHGLKDKGKTTEHQFLFLKKIN